MNVPSAKSLTEKEENMEKREIKEDDEYKDPVVVKKKRKTTIDEEDAEVEFVEIGKNPMPTDLMLPYELSMFTELHESDAQGGALIITSKGLGKWLRNICLVFIVTNVGT